MLSLREGERGRGEDFDIFWKHISIKAPLARTTEM